MVVRTRLRAILMPLALYALSAASVSYFVWHAKHGDRGLEAKVVYKAKMRELGTELAGLKDERVRWERRVAMMQANAVDSDLLDEETRLALGRVSKNDLVVLLPPRP